MSRQYYLSVRVQAPYKTYESLLPFNMQTYLRLIHEQSIMLAVFHQYSQQDYQHLFLTRRQLIRSQMHIALNEQNLIASSVYFLVSLKSSSIVFWNFVFGKETC